MSTWTTASWVVTCYLRRFLIVSPHLPPLHPVFVIQNLTIYPDDVEVCNGGKTIQLASDESVFCIDGCQPGYSFCVTDNAKSATYKNGDIYSVTMTPAKIHSNDFTCGNAGNKEIKGSEVETCFFDRYWNCNLFKPCDLCDFRSSCPRWRYEGAVGIIQLTPDQRNGSLSCTPASVHRVIPKWDSKYRFCVHIVCIISRHFAQFMWLSLF